MEWHVFTIKNVISRFTFNRKEKNIIRKKKQDTTVDNYIT